MITKNGKTYDVEGQRPESALPKDNFPFTGETAGARRVGLARGGIYSWNFTEGTKLSTSKDSVHDSASQLTDTSVTAKTCGEKKCL